MTQEIYSRFLSGIIKPHYFKVVENLEDVLVNRESNLIAIDGRSGVGKTELSRFLSWRFNICLVETDIFFSTRTSKKQTEYDALRRVIERQVNSRRPVFVEGIKILETLEEIEQTPSYLIYLNPKKSPNQLTLRKTVYDYEKKYNPQKMADLIVKYEIPEV
ncbi:MAG: hypothetical protein ACK4NV_14365 [Pannonibacter sp.]